MHSMHLEVEIFAVHCVFWKVVKMKLQTVPLKIVASKNILENVWMKLLGIRKIDLTGVAVPIDLSLIFFFKIRVPLA